MTATAWRRSQDLPERKCGAVSASLRRVGTERFGVLKMRSSRRAVLALSLSVAALAATPPVPALAEEDLPGSELLTSQERAEYRQRMRGMLSAGEQDQIRRRYEALINQRAKEQGATVPGQTENGPQPGPGGGSPGGRGSTQ
jgi:hypothetical protein